MARHPHPSPLPRRADRGRQNGIVATIQPRLPVIPSAVRNLKSITTRPVSRCHVYVMTNSGKKRENSPGRLYLRTDTLDSSTPLRCAQNDSDGVAFSSLESGSIVKCLPLSAHDGRGDTQPSHEWERGLRDGERCAFPLIGPNGVGPAILEIFAKYTTFGDIWRLCCCYCQVGPAIPRRRRNEGVAGVLVGRRDSRIAPTTGSPDVILEERRYGGGSDGEGSAFP